MQNEQWLNGSWCQQLKLFILFSLLLQQTTIVAQPIAQDSTDYDYAKINSLALDADVASVMQLISKSSDKPLTQKAMSIKQKYERRFLSDEPDNDYITERPSTLNELLLIYVNYWKAALVKPNEKLDSSLIASLATFLAKEFQIEKAVATDSVRVLLKKYIENAGYKTTGFSRTGKLLDLLIWKEQTDTTYSFTINKKPIRPKVVFMDSFLTLGWEEFATFGRSYPGGWTTKDAIYCVRKAYNLGSENFQISYLAHEGNHFKDKQEFPSLSATDLEYRAKLTELSLAKATIYEVINNFIRNANPNSQNAHSLANYYVVRDLSKALLGAELEKDGQKWKTISPEKINRMATKLYKKNTKALMNKGASSVEKYIM